MDGNYDEVKRKIIEYIKINRVSTTEVADCLGKIGVIENALPLNRGHFCVGEIRYLFAVGESNWNVHEDLEKEVILYQNIQYCIKEQGQL